MSPSVFSGTSSSLNLVRRLGPKVLLSLLVLELLLDGQDAGCRRDQQQELLHDWYSFVQPLAGQREGQSIREPDWARIGICDSPGALPRRDTNTPGEAPNPRKGR